MYDVLIIGGGVIGLSCARELAARGLKVAVLERQACGRESSWAGAGIIESGNRPRHDPLAGLQRAAVKAYPAFAAGLLEETGIDPEYEACGVLKILDQADRPATSPEEVITSKERGRAEERAVRVLSGEEARRLVPGLSPRVSAARYDPMAGQVRNPRLLAALTASCRRRGVVLAENEEVLSLRSAGGRVEGVWTARQAWSAGQVVLAAGAWSSLVEPALAELMPVVPVRGQMILLHTGCRPFGPVIERGQRYLVPRRDGHVLLGATVEREAGYDKRTTEPGLSSLLRFERWLPAISEWTVVRCWAGLRPGTPDNRPYIGPVPGWTGLWAATGHHRCGLTLAPVTASLIADLLTVGRTEHALSTLFPGRPLKRPDPAQA